MEPEARQAFLRNLNEPPHLKLSVPGAGAKTAPRSPKKKAAKKKPPARKATRGRKKPVVRKRPKKTRRAKRR
jgi:hypothetical protein